MSKRKKKASTGTEAGKSGEVIDGVAEEVSADARSDAPADPDEAAAEPIEAPGDEPVPEPVYEPVSDSAEERAEEPAGDTYEDADQEADQEAASGGRTGWLAAGALAAAIAGAGGITYISPWLADNLPGGLASYFKPADTGAGARLGAIESALGTLESEVNAIGSSLDTIGQKLEVAASAPAPDITGPVTALEGRIGERLTALEAAVARNADMARAVDISPVTARLGQIEAALTTATESGGGGSTAIAAIAADVAALGLEVSALEQKLATVSQVAAQTSAQVQEIAVLSDRLGKLEADGNGKAAARAIALASLSGAIGRGSYNAELDAFRALSPDAMATPALNGLAASGLPAIAELQTEFSTALPRALKADTAPDANASWSDKLIGNALNVVTVRPVGEVAGDGTPAVLARAEVRIRAGDIGAALSELEALKGPAREAMAAWTTRAGARLAALVELEELKQSSLAAISGATN